MNTGTKKSIIPYLLIVFLCYTYMKGNAQQKPLVSNQFNLVLHYKDSALSTLPIQIKTSFTDLQPLYDQINSIPKMLAMKGYATASVDSIWQLGNVVNIILFVGKKYQWMNLRTNGIDKYILDKAGYMEKNFSNKPLNILEVDNIKERLISIYEKEGYPFAMIYLDSVNINDDKISATLKVNKVLLYYIDSIQNNGTLKLNPKFLQRYIGISNGSPYNREKLIEVDKKMLELPYAETVQGSYLNMVGSGATLNLNVNNKKSSEVSAILGFLPDANNTGKFQLTGDVNLDLKNLFGAGEGLLFKYQSLQPKSPRLNIGFDKPFVFQTPFGLNFLFELFKKDSSFLQLNAQLGIQLNLATNQFGKILLQVQNTNLLQGGIDTNFVILQKKLPDIIDVKSTNVGFNYELLKTNYRFNPLNGNEISFATTIGIKNIKKNNDILAIKSSVYDFSTLYDSIKLRTYQLRLKLKAAHYFQLSKSSTFKTALNAGIYNSPSIFRNEVFQIGGYKILRGFDEESIYATKYAVLTAEYRSLISLNSYLFGFIDIGSTQTKFQNFNTNNLFIGSGIGIVYETKAGLLNLSLALGKRNDIPFSLKQASKIHFGYINYF